MSSPITIDSSLSLQDNLNQALRPVIDSFNATTAPIADKNGKATDIHSSVIYNGGANPTTVQIDNVAAVIDCYESMTIETLRIAYERIRLAKSLEKTDREGPENGEIAMTAGFIVARDSDLTLEQIASEISQLNESSPSHHWPDVIAILSKGIINYTAQLPGTDRIGDFFLPAQSTMANRSSPSPSIYIQEMIRATGELTLNKVVSLVMVRVAIFQPGINIPNYKDLIVDIPSHGVSVGTYQFNLSKALVAMTQEQIIASQLPPDIFNITSGKKDLGSIQFQSWQDGGIIIVRGGFPIDLFLISLKKIIPELPLTGAQYFRSPNLQVSFVLPINAIQFSETLAHFQSNASNISIRRDSSKILVQQIGEEGTSSPFIARLMMGTLNLRDAVHTNSTSRTSFDNRYEQVLTGVRSARDASKEISGRWEQHRDNVQSGTVVRFDGRKVHISESIDRILKREFDSFVNSAVRTIKNSMQDLAKDYGIEIGFLFAKEQAFQAGIAKTKVSEPALADYLISTRHWSEPLVLLRNDLEHGTIPSPKVLYALDRSPVEAQEPRFEGMPITEFTSKGLDRICCFVEELTAFCLQKKLPKGFEITEIPLAERNTSAPVRFKLTVNPGGKKPWTLFPHTEKFEEV